MKPLGQLRQTCQVAFAAAVLAGLGMTGVRAVGLTDNSDIYGHWRIAKVIGAADVAAMSDKQARALVGRSVEIKASAFVFNGEVCDRPNYERTQQDLVLSFREQGHASPANMGLPDPVTAIDARCTHIFLKRPGVIVIHWEGYYFDAVKFPQLKR